MYLRRSLLLSVGIHLTLIISAISLARIIHVPIPQTKEESVVKVLLRSIPQQSKSVIPQPLVSIQKKPLTPQPILKPKPLRQEIESMPKVPSTIQPLVRPAPVQPALTSQPVMIPAPAATVKTAVSDAPKKIAPPPPPKVEENYEDNHLGEIRAILAERLKYPKNARRLNQQGEVSVTFTLSQNGEVGQIAITKSSGFDLLDEAAQTLITTASPEFPKPSKSVRITVPISYTLR